MALFGVAPKLAAADPVVAEHEALVAQRAAGALVQARAVLAEDREGHPGSRQN